MKRQRTADGTTAHHTKSWGWLLLLGLAAVPAWASPPTFIQEPGAQSLLVGQNAVFTTSVLSDKPIEYQWRLNDVDLPGQKSSSLTVFCVSPAQTGQMYSVKASTTDGSVTSGPAPLQVQVPLGAARPFSWGSDPIAAYQRFFPTAYRTSIDAVFEVTLIDTDPGGLWGTDSYTDDSSLSAAAVHAGLLAAGEPGTIRLKITGPQTNYVGSLRHGITSNAYGAWHGSYQLLGRVPTITRHPVTHARMVGGTARFEVQASGTGTLRYQWYFNGTAMAGATGSSVSFPVATTADAGSYLCTVTDDALGTATSAYAVLGVLPATPGQPQSQLTNVNELAIGSVVRVVLTGTTSGGGLYGTGAYQTNSDPSRAAVHAGLLTPGETGTVAIVRMPDQLAFLGDSAHGVTSTAYNAPGPSFAFLARVPHVTLDPPTLALLPGRTATLTFSATYPQPYTIQWRRNEVPVDGQTSSTLTVTAEAPGTSSTFDAVLTAPGAPTLTEPARVVTIDPAGGHVYTVATAQQATPILLTAGNLVFVTVQGVTEGGPLWGTDVYTHDSNLSRIAVHAGLLSPGQVGQIGVYSLGPWPSFVSTTRNGITSSSYSAYTAMALLAPSPPTPPARVTTIAPGNLVLSNVAGPLAQIWASSSLLPSSWIPLDTVNVTTFPQSWTDPTPDKPPTRYYRVVVP